MNEETAEQPRRRRRRRGRRGGRGRSEHPGEGPQPQQTAPRQAPMPPEWNWRTFPVLFAFSVGVVVMGLAVASPVLSFVVFIIGIMGVAFGLAHITTRSIVARRRRQR